MRLNHTAWLQMSLWDRMAYAVKVVRHRLLRSTAGLAAAKIPYAVAGGHGVAAWVARIDPCATRNTPDINILVRREDADAATRTLIELEFIPTETPVGLKYLDGPEANQRHSVQLFFAGEKINEDDILPTATLDESVDDTDFRIVTLDALVRMKLTAFRNKDRMHIRDLMDVGLVDATWPPRLIPALAVRLQEILNDPRG